MFTRRVITAPATFVLYLAAVFAPPLRAQSNVAQPASPPRSIVLHAAHLLDVETGRTISPGEILVQGERIAEVGSHVTHPARIAAHRSRRRHAAARPDRRARPPFPASRRGRFADRPRIRPAAHHSRHAGRTRRSDGRLHRRARHGHRRRRLRRHRRSQCHRSTA